MSKVECVIEFNIDDRILIDEDFIDLFEDKVIDALCILYDDFNELNFKFDFKVKKMVKHE